MHARQNASPPDHTNVLQPDILLPGQLSGSDDAPRSGVRGLLWAVFIDGVQTYLDEAQAGRCDGSVFREAEHWVLRSNTEEVTSFVSLCDLFDVEARDLRIRLIETREQARRLARTARPIAA